MLNVSKLVFCAIFKDDIMLKSIAEVSPELTQFVEALELPLSVPQQRHVKQMADGLITLPPSWNAT